MGCKCLTASLIGIALTTGSAWSAGPAGIDFVPVTNAMLQNPLPAD